MNTLCLCMQYYGDSKRKIVINKTSFVCGFFPRHSRASMKVSLPYTHSFHVVFRLTYPKFSNEFNLCLQAGWGDCGVRRPVEHDNNKSHTN